MWDSIILGTLVLCCVVGVLMTALRLPGTWVILAAAIGYGWWTDWQRIGAVLAGVLCGIAVVGEIVEFAVSALTTRRAGASRQAAWGGLIGGFIGMIFLASLLSLPLPVVGTMMGAVAGAMVGCFGGALITELAVRKQLVHGTRVGAFAAVGFVLGVASKIGLALVMSALVIIAALWPLPDATPPETPSSLARISGQLAENTADACRAGNGSNVIHAQPLHDVASLEQIRRRDPPLLVGILLDDSIAFGFPIARK